MIDVWLNKIKIIKAANTYKTYSRAMQAWFPQKETLTEQYIINMIQLFAKNVSHNTIALRLTILRSYLEDLQTKPKDYDRIIKLCKGYKPEQKIRPCASVNDFKRLYQVSNSKYRVIYCLLFQCGLRVSEVVNLNVSDISKDNILIRETKGKRQRLAPITPQLRKSLTTYIIERNTMVEREKYLGNSLLVSEHGRLTKNAVQKKVSHDCNMIGAGQLSCHSMRHGAVSNLLHAGVDLETIRQFAGHSSLQTTQRYLHMDSETMLNKVNKIYENMEM